MKDKAFVGIFKSEGGILAAARAARKKGFPIKDAYTPYPVHGMDEALDLEPSWLSGACLGLGLTGLTGALAFQYWVSVFDWPMNIGGKPFDASPALVPIAFELTVLVAGVGTVVLLLASRGLLPGRKPAVPAPGATDDRFLLVLAAGSEKEEAVRALCLECGAVEVKAAPEAAS